MSSLFGPRRGRVKPPKRNRFDMSHQHLNTTDFGLVKPFFCKEVIGGDSVSLDPVCAIRSHPIVFPINTRMRMYAHYFYVRNRTLWRDWENFIFKTKEGLTPPYLQLTPERAKKMIGTGSLGDCLGVPSTIAASYPITRTVNFNVPDFYNFNFNSLVGHRTKSSVVSALYPYIDDSLHPLLAFSSPTRGYSKENSSLFYGYLSNVIDFSLPYKFSSSPFLASSSFDPVPSFDGYVLFLTPDNVVADTGVSETLFNCHFSAHSDSNRMVVDYTIVPDSHSSISDVTNYLINKYGSYKILFLSIVDSDGALISQPPYFNFAPTSADLMPSSLTYLVKPSGVFDATDDTFIDSNKFVGDNPQIPLSALPFRACEMISNYFFRNDQNNPYILNGEAQYNQFIPTTDGGPDTNEYLIHHRNWEFDAYTSAVPSPQFGAAPLVGVTYAGGREAELTFQGSDSDGVVQDYKVKVGLADDGVIQSVIDFDKGVPSGSLRELIDLSSVGISINDLRNVNAYQRFKENCLRRSLRYRDQMLSHLGVNVDYPDIDVPQFIGGFSGDLVVSPVTNMAETETAMLGDVAGKIEAVIKSNHRITCYCPEHGFIIGMFSIVPIPTYSQLLPKAFTRYDAFDYFQSEFGKIGYVPIFHRELFPLQSDDPDKVFGYQRAWYDYMSSPDEVHGDFRTSLADFVLYRTFNEEPSLNEDFTTVQSDSLNNIFAVDKVDEKYKNSEHFMVQFYHDAVFKRPIPKYGMPSLE